LLDPADPKRTHGGSGGPVLDMQGNVVAVNAAILPEYGGSNFGVRATKVRALLEVAGLRLSRCPSTGNPGPMAAREEQRSGASGWSFHAIDLNQRQAP
jgi:hypothetical protein